MAPPKQRTTTVRGVSGKLFDSPPTASSDGLVCILRASPSPPTSTSAFTVTAFSSTGDELAALDEKGRLTVFYLASNRYAVLKRAGARGVQIAYSPSSRAVVGALGRPSELFVALADASIECFDTASKQLLGVMRHPGLNHTIRKLELHPTRDLLLSCSSEAATLWSTTTFGRLRALNAEKTRPLLDAAFVPPADTLLTCFESAVVQWTLGPTCAATATYHVNADAVRLKTITVSSDGALLVGAGEGGWLAVWSLVKQEILRIVRLPPAAGAVSSLTFLPAGGAGGALDVVEEKSGARRQTLALVCADGALRIVEPTEALLLRTLKPSYGGAPGALAGVTVDSGGRHLASTLGDGSIVVHHLDTLCAGAPVGEFGELHQIAAKPGASKRLNDALDDDAPPPLPPIEQPYVGDGSVDWERNSNSQDGAFSLDAPRVRAMLRRCGELPAKYRTLAWRFLLEFPRNADAYAALSRRGVHSAFADLHLQLPLGDRRLLERLRRLLSCLAHWCAPLASVAGLPSFVFPWVLTHEGDELGAFEACAAVLANWGQVTASRRLHRRHHNHDLILLLSPQALFACHPHPPLEALAQASRLLSIHCPALHQHLAQIEVGPDVWAW